jgi:hypothetical protein
MEPLEWEYATYGVWLAESRQKPGEWYIVTVSDLGKFVITTTSQRLWPLEDSASVTVAFDASKQQCDWAETEHAASAITDDLVTWKSVRVGGMVGQSMFLHGSGKKRYYRIERSSDHKGFFVLPYVEGYGVYTEFSVEAAAKVCRDIESSCRNGD